MFSLWFLFFFTPPDKEFLSFPNLAMTRGKISFQMTLSKKVLTDFSRLTIRSYLSKTIALVIALEL